MLYNLKWQAGSMSNPLASCNYIKKVILDSMLPTHRILCSPFVPLITHMLSNEHQMDKMAGKRIAPENFIRASLCFIFLVFSGG